MTYVEWLHRGALPRDRAGGKGASLSALTAAGFEVPLGFVVNAAGYRAFAAAAGLDALIAENESLFADPSHAGEASAAVQAAIMATGLPSDLRDEIAMAYDELTAATGLACAVRSSAVSEDGDKASFAGLYESYLNLQGVASVLDGVRRCYASLWAERAVSYRAMRGSNGSDEAMAVVVMDLVPAEAAGIAFTVHPVTGDRDCVLINASFGLGEAVVSGRVTPDSFVVRKAGLELLEREIYAKQLAIYPHPDTPGTMDVELDAVKASAASITDHQAQAVAALAARAESAFGAPQDVEWGLAGGHIYMLQSRPITTLF
jgi:pyruvate,water dikinase